MRTSTLFLFGLVLGSVMGFALLVAGPATLVPGAIVWTWLIARRPRFVTGSGALMGFGAMWLLLLGQAAWRCASDVTCSQPEVTPWLATGLVILIIGTALALYSRTRLARG